MQMPSRAREAHIFMSKTNSEQRNTKHNFPRPPVVVILGHVDHGKTTILDYIRKSRVAAKEAGGITQHIGAYQVTIDNKQVTGDSRTITFLDTPGHEAFSAIRSRGAQVADVAILVVAADEGVKPQTKEAIRIIKESNTPYLVAINKIDREGSNPAKVRQELAENDVLVEDYGGQVPVVEISAKSGKGVDQLLETILLMAEMEELVDAKSSEPATGYVLESHLDSRRGTVATLLVRQGKLRVGDWVSAGVAMAKVKSMEDFTGVSIKEAGASEPCVVLGWEGIPALGVKFVGSDNYDEILKKSSEANTLGSSVIFTYEAGAVDGVPKLVANLLIKADVQSSLEALDAVFKTIRSEDVEYRVVGFGVGKINDNDIKQAGAKKAAIVGFHVDVDPKAVRLSEREHVRIETADIIYELVEKVRDIMSELLPPEIKRTDLGKLKVLALFGGTNRAQIIGGKIIQGKAVRGSMISATRGPKILFLAKLGQLQQKKADVTEVPEGLECGMRIDVPASVINPAMIQIGDLLEIFSEEKIKRSI